MNEHFITVARTARYYSMGGAHAREVWIVCHGYAQLARFFLRQFEPIADDSRLIVAPEALNRYYFDSAPGVHAADARVGATWMTREDRAHEIADYIAYLDAVHERVSNDVAPSIMVGFGFSQGTATVSRWAASGRSRLNHVVLWGGSVAHDLDAASLRGQALTIALGDRDTQVAPERVPAETQRLDGAGINYELFRYQGGHRVEADALRTLARRIRTLTSAARSSEQLEPDEAGHDE